MKEGDKEGRLASFISHFKDISFYFCLMFSEDMGLKHVTWKVLFFQFSIILLKKQKQKVATVLSYNSPVSQN